MKKLDTSSLSQRAKQEILSYINEMDLSSGTKLPREEAMAEMLGVSRITIRKVLAELCTEGRIFRIQGKGTFVNSAFLNMKVTFDPVMEFTQMIEKSGFHAEMKILEIKEVQGEEQIRRYLKLENEDVLMVARKAFYADGRLCVMCRDYYKATLVNVDTSEEQEEESFQHKSVYPYLYEKKGIRLAWDRVEISTALSTEIRDFAECIEKNNTGLRPYLYLKEINYDKDNKPLLYVEEYIDTEIIRYNMIRSKNIDYGRMK